MQSPLSPKSKEEAYFLLKELFSLNLEQSTFILAWHEIMRLEKKEFGFRNAVGFKQQLEMAVEFFLRIQKKWQEVTLSNKEFLSFTDIFANESKNEGIDLPDNFIEKITKKMEEL